MMRRRSGWTITGLLLAAGLLTPASADAQWYFGTYTGANHTRPASVSIAQPAHGLDLTFHDVNFDAEPFTSPQYYGARIGRLFDRSGLGVEVEFLHIKVISRSDEVVRVTGADGFGPIDLDLRMDVIAQRFNMTHGLNYFLGNLVWRRPIGGGSDGEGVVAVLRAGVGPIVAGVDSVINHVSVQGYQHAGYGGQVSAGLDVRIWSLLSATGEYKFTRSRPRLEIASGTGRTTAISHHVAVGFALGFARR